MYGIPAMICFTVVPVWFRSHHIFECYTLSGYRARIMSNQTAPNPPLQATLPHLYGSITPFTHLEEKSSMV
jgi:hypothetical protein